MSSDIVAMMLGVSIFLGFLGLIAFVWGLKRGQFDDSKKFTEGLLYDNEEDLNEAIELERRKKDKLNKKNRKCNLD